VIKAGRDVPLAATRIYQLSFFTGFGVSAIIYYLLNRAFPVPGKADKFKEVDESRYLDSVERTGWVGGEETPEEDDASTAKKNGDDEEISV
jgi:nucleobase:cation symporter-1, NCS1 family